MIEGRRAALCLAAALSCLPAAAPSAAAEAYAVAASSAASTGARRYWEREQALRRRLAERRRRMRASAYGATAVTTAPRDVSARVTRASGGRLRRSDRVRLSVPPGALKEDLTLAATAPPPEREAEAKVGAARQRLAAASSPVEFLPSGVSFDKPVVLTIPYSPAAGMDESALRVHRWEPQEGRWEPLETVLDGRRRVAQARTKHFSLYQVLGPGGAGIGVAAADASFGFKALYAFPNPVRGQGAATFRVQPGVADSISVRIYDISGRLIHESSSFTDRGAFDDGNGLGAQFTYDHLWDVSGVGSGVYTYVVTAKRSGQSDIRRSGRVAIVK